MVLPLSAVSTLAELEIARIVPVVVLDDPADAAPLGRALVAGGITAIEVTLRTPAGLEGIAHAAGVEGLTVAAGTVLDPQEVARVVDRGARAIVSPGLDADVVAASLALDVLPLPGVATPSDVQAAKRLGLDHLKLFPAGVLGGTAMLSALTGPFPTVRFLPSGGVSASNAAEFVAHPSVFAVSGSWMVPRDAIAARDWHRIESLAADAVRALGTGVGA